MRTQIMKLVRLKIAILAIVSCAVPCLADDLQTAMRNCAWCHGSLGQGYAIAPRLAGQRREYTMNQLISFGEHTRDNPHSRQYMWGAAANLSPQMARDLANYLSLLPAEAASDGCKELVGMGRTIYEEGIPDSNIVACSACHGPNAEGVRDIPRLGGLSYPYLKRRLEQWGEGYHLTAKFPMPRIASKLSQNEIDALASYLSFLK